MAPPPVAGDSTTAEVLVKAGTRSYALSCLHSTLPRVARTISPQEVVVIDWQNRDELGRFRGDVGTVLAVALHPDGDRVAVSGEAGRTEVWSASKVERVAQLPVAATGLHYAPNGHLLAGEPGRLSCWDGATLVWERLNEGAMQNPAILDVHADGLVLWTAFGSPRMEILDLATGQLRQAWDTRDEFMAACIHPDGKRIATALNTVRSPLLHQFAMFRIGADLPEREFPIPFMSVSVAVSPGGGSIATGDARGVQLWDYASGAPEGRLSPRTEAKIKEFGTVEIASPFMVSQIRYEADGKGLASDGDRFCCWDIASRNDLWVYPS